MKSKIPDPVSMHRLFKFNAFWETKGSTYSETPKIRTDVSSDFRQKLERFGKNIFIKRYRLLWIMVLHCIMPKIWLLLCNLFGESLVRYSDR